MRTPAVQYYMYYKIRNWTSRTGVSSKEIPEIIFSLITKKLLKTLNNIHATQVLIWSPCINCWFTCTVVQVHWPCIAIKIDLNWDWKNYYTHLHVYNQKKLIYVHSKTSVMKSFNHPCIAHCRFSLRRFCFKLWYVSHYNHS